MSDEVTYRELEPDEVIMPGDQWLLGGSETWQAVGPSIGRTVKDQKAREENYADKFRRRA